MKHYYGVKIKENSIGMGEIRNAYKIFVRKSETKRLFGG
jgi:hypothetical protein